MKKRNNGEEPEERNEREKGGPIDPADFMSGPDEEDTPVSHYKERGKKGVGMKAFLIALAVVVVAAGVACAASYFTGHPLFPQKGEGEMLDLPGKDEGQNPDGQNLNPARDNEGERDDNRSQLEKMSDPNNEYTNFLLCGVDKSEALTDVILVASLNKKDNTVTLLQIPRDCYVGDEQVTGKINSIYGHNPSGENDISYLIDAIEQRLWIPIDYYGIINLETVRDVVDAMGGVPVNLPRDIYYKPNKVLYAGEQVLNGEQSEWMIRYRKGYTTGDIGRLDMQKVFLKAFAAKVKSLGVLELGKLAQQFYNKIENNMSIGDILGLVPSVLGINMDRVEICTIPGNGVMHNTYAIYAVDKEGAAELLNEYFWHGTTPLTADDIDFPDVVDDAYAYSAQSTQYTQPAVPQEPVQPENAGTEDDGANGNEPEPQADDFEDTKPQEPSGGGKLQLGGGTTEPEPQPEEPSGAHLVLKGTED